MGEGNVRQHFTDPCQVADDAMQMYVQETFYRFYTTKKMPHVTTMRSVGSHSQVYYDNFQSRLLLFTALSTLPISVA